MVAAVPVPHLPPGVAGVGQDRRDRPQRPCLAAAVRIAPPVQRRRARHTPVIELAGDPRLATTREPLGEHPPHLRCRRGVGREPMRPPSPARMRPVRVRTRIHQPIAIRWSATEVAALRPHLGTHRGQRPMPGTQYLPPRHRPQQQHQRSMRRIRGVDRSTGFGQPEPHRMAFQHADDGRALIVLERSLVLPHHHRIEPAVGVGQGRLQRGRFRPLHPGHPARYPDVEELRHDRPMPRDEILGHPPLPPRRGLLAEGLRGVDLDYNSQSVLSAARRGVVPVQRR